MRRLAILLILFSAGCGEGLVASGRDSGASGDSGANVDASPVDGALPDHDAEGGALPDTGVMADAGSPIIDAATVSVPSGGSGGAYPGAQTRTATMAGGDAVEYALYIPSSYTPARPWPLLTVFHGQGDSGANMVRFWTATAEADGFILLGTTSTGSSGGWRAGPDVGRYDAALTDALGAYNVEEKRIYVWGFSAGAHLTHALALMNVDLFAAYSVSAGALQALAGTGAPAAASRQIPVDIHVGMSDRLYPAAVSDRALFTRAGWLEGTDLSWSPFDGGHTLLRTHPAEIWEFLSPFRLP